MNGQQTQYLRRVAFYILYLLALLTSPVFAHKTAAMDKITALPILGTLQDEEYAGYLPLSASLKESSGHLFYWYVAHKTHDQHTPIILWLNGGPGASSLYGFFMEHGPYTLNQPGVITQRPDSWATKAHYLIIDQPAGVGFSYGTTCYADEAEAMDQLYYALQVFLKRHPTLAQSPLYLAGESYAGKYLAQLAIRIINGNQRDRVHKIALQGLLLGDAWVNPKVQQYANVDYAYAHGLISAAEKKQVLKLYHACAHAIDKTKPSSRQANKTCNRIQDFIKKASGGLNLANTATDKEPDDHPMIDYLNRSQVRQALHVDPRVKNFQTFSAAVAERLEIGEQDSVAFLYPKILAAGVRVLIYNGLNDAKDSNFISTQLWLRALDWPFKKQFATAPRCVWRVNHQVAGYVRTAGNLTQVTIRNAGHLAPIDQPQYVFNLLSRFIDKQSLCETK